MTKAKQAGAAAYVISKNIHRRHLTTDQKCDLIAKLIKAHIEKGDKAKDKAEQHYIAAGLHLKELKEAAGEK